MHNNIKYFNGNNNNKSDYIKLNNFRNLNEKFEKSKNNSASKSRNLLSIKDRNYNNISNLLNVSISSNKYLKNSNENNVYNLNLTNCSRAKSIGLKDIKRFNNFVNIKDLFFKLKPEKSSERKNKKLKEKENETVFNTSMNGILNFKFFVHFRIFFCKKFFND